MVGWFQRKSTPALNTGTQRDMADTASGKAANKRSGVFFSKSGSDYVVLWQGREICRYESMQAFVEAHAAGLAALESNQADLLERYYNSIGISSGSSGGKS